MDRPHLLESHLIRRHSHGAPSASSSRQPAAFQDLGTEFQSAGIIQVHDVDRGATGVAQTRNAASTAKWSDHRSRRG
jgi:hypothetical protein